MNYARTPGVYRCRLTLDGDGRPAIFVNEIFGWDKANKQIDYTDNRGGLQVCFQAEGWLIGDDGSLAESPEIVTTGELFGLVLMTTRQNGEKLLAGRIRALSEIFGVRADAIDELNNLTADAVKDVEFDVVLAESDRMDKHGKPFVRISDIYPAGQANRGGGAPAAFARRPVTLSTKDKLRAKVMAELGQVKPAASAPKAPTLPKAAAPAKPAAKLPPREERPVAVWSWEAVWNAWLAANPEDRDGVKLYAELEAFGAPAGVPLDKLDGGLLTRFANGKGLSASSSGADEDNMPF